MPLAVVRSLFRRVLCFKRSTHQETEEAAHCMLIHLSYAPCSFKTRPRMTSASPPREIASESHPLLVTAPPSNANRPLRCLRLCDAAAMPSVGARAEAAAEALDLEGCDLTSRSTAVQEAVPFSGSGASGTSSTRPAVPQGGMGGQFSEGSRRWDSMRTQAPNGCAMALILFT